MKGRSRLARALRDFSIMVGRSFNDQSDMDWFEHEKFASYFNCLRVAGRDEARAMFGTGLTAWAARYYRGAAA